MDAADKRQIGALLRLVASDDFAVGQFLGQRDVALQRSAILVSTPNCSSVPNQVYTRHSRV